MRMLRGAATTAITVCLLALGASGAAAASYKPYALTMAPASVPGGSTVTITATYLNENNPGGQLVGSANLFPPSGMQVTSASTPAGTATVTGSCTDGSLTGPCVQLRNMDVMPGASLRVTMQVVTPGCGGAGSYTWSDEAKQSNDFSGTGNDVTLDSAGSSLTTTVGPAACAVKFVQSGEPADANVGQTISSSAENPAGGPVQAEIVDQNGNVVNGSSAPITVALGSGSPAGGTLSGTLTEAAVNGVASFANLSINQAGYGYTLQASSPGLGSGGSSKFNEYSTGSSTVCPENVNCTGTASDSTTQGAQTSQSLSVTASYSPTLTDAGLLYTELDQGVSYWAQHATQCGGYTPIGQDTDIFYMTASTRSKSFTDTVSANVPDLAAFTQLLSAQGLCFAAPYPFVGANGAATATTLPDGTPGYIAKLDTCANEPHQPCVSSSSGVLNGLLGTFTITASVPAGQSGDPTAGH